MLICAIISLRWHGEADAFPENWKISRRFLLFLFRPTTVSDCRKNAIALVIQGLLSLFPSLTSFNSAFGHSINKKGLDISPYIISFRVVRFKLSDSSFETVLTNLDFPPDELKHLDTVRWGIETSFRKLKYTIGLSYFHAKRPDFILQKIFARLTMYNFSELISMSVMIECSHNK